MEMQTPYLSAAVLRIAEWERAALIRLVPLLESGRIEFNMEIDCGTACCIGGHVALLSFGVNQCLPVQIQIIYVQSTGNIKHPLHALYWPDGPALRTEDPLKGAAAIMNFLTTGKPQWERVMGEEG